MIEQPTVSINLKGLTKFRGELGAGSSDTQARVLKVWEFRYKGFIFNRFNSFSRGGGDWPALAESTIAKRRSGGGDGSPAILVDIGLLRGALTPVVTPPPGWESKKGPWQVEVGYGGAAAHGEGGHATIADIASFHNRGTDHLPKRTIIVKPPDDVLKAMGVDAARILNKRGGELTGGT